MVIFCPRPRSRQSTPGLAAEKKQGRNAALPGSLGNVEVSLYSGTVLLSPRQAKARTHTTPATNHPVSKGVSPPQVARSGKQLPSIELANATILLTGLDL